MKEDILQRPVKVLKQIFFIMTRASTSDNRNNIFIRILIISIK